MKTAFSCILLLFFFTGFSQEATYTVTGKVTDSSSGQPLSNASIFARNTTLGTVTTSDGNFKLSLPRGGYDLIVSYTGYETQELHISATTTGNINFALLQTDKTLSEVVVSGSNEVENGMEKYGNFFLQNFIGTTPNAALCKIENPEVLQFFFSKKRNRLKIKGKEELRIRNEALGYSIRYQLDSFAHDYSTGITIYTGNPFFQELEGTPEQKAKWDSSRVKAYNGSKLHFMRSLYDSTLSDEGFTIEWIDTTKKVLTTIPVANPYDSTTYSVVENDDVEISRKGKWRVIYNKEVPDKRFLAAFKLPAYLRAQLTTIDILDTFVIEQNGYYYNQTDIIDNGYWSWEKVADALPYDYNP